MYCLLLKTIISTLLWCLLVAYFYIVVVHHTVKIIFLYYKGGLNGTKSCSIFSTANWLVVAYRCWFYFIFSKVDIYGHWLRYNLFDADFRCLRFIKMYTKIDKARFHAFQPPLENIYSTSSENLLNELVLFVSVSPLFVAMRTGCILWWPYICPQIHSEKYNFD